MDFSLSETLLRCSICGYQLDRPTSTCRSCGGWRVPPSSVAPSFRPVAAPKSPTLAVLLTLLYVGTGHLYVGRDGVALILLSVQTVLVLMSITFIGWFLAVLTWAPLVLASACDAVVSARRFNERQRLL